MPFLTQLNPFFGFHDAKCVSVWLKKLLIHKFEWHIFDLRCLATVSRTSQDFRFWWVIITAFYQLMLQSWYQKTVHSLVNTLLSFSWYNIFVIQSTLTFSFNCYNSKTSSVKIKGGSEAPTQNFFKTNFAKSCILSCKSKFDNKKLGSPSSFLSY